MVTIQCANREAATHNGMTVTKCFKQSSLLTRKYLVSTSTLMKTYKPLAVLRKSFVLSDGVVEAMKASDGKNTWRSRFDGCTFCGLLQSTQTI